MIGDTLYFEGEITFGDISKVIQNQVVNNEGVTLFLFENYFI